MGVEQDDADVRAEPFPIEHDAPRNFLPARAFLHIYPQIPAPAMVSAGETGGSRIKQGHLYKDWTHLPANPLKLG
jgi:hypothetical protein